LFPVKTSAKYYHLTVGAQGQAKWPKSPPLMTSLTKKPHPPGKEFFSSAIY